MDAIIPVSAEQGKPVPDPDTHDTLDAIRLVHHDTLIRWIDTSPLPAFEAINLLHALLKNLAFVRYGVVLPCQLSPGSIGDPRR